MYVLDEVIQYFFHLKWDVAYILWIEEIHSGARVNKGQGGLGLDILPQPRITRKKKKEKKKRTSRLNAIK